jgi:hypothetical protein
VGGRITVAAAAEPIAPTFSELLPKETPEETYAVNAFGIVRVESRDNATWRPIRGLVYRMPVERDAFFTALGRRDLADQFVSRRRTGTLVKVLGTSALVTGIVVGLWGLDSGRGWLTLTGLGMIVGGGIAEEVGASLRKPNFPGDDAMDMAVRYNQGLRQHLGLPGDQDNGEPAPRRRLSLSGVAPWVLSGGGGLAGAARF